MKDLIERQEAIDALNQQIRQCDKALADFNISMKDEYAVKVERASLTAYKEQLEYLPSSQQWIPCGERLPDGDTDVLVSVHVRGVKHNTKKGCYWRIKPSYYVDIAQMIGGDWVCNMDEYLINRDRHKVVAWMPLPTPWEGGRDE